MVGRVALLRGVTGDNEEFVLGCITVGAVRILPRSKSAVGHVDRLWALVTVVPTIPAGDIGKITDSSHILKRVVQKSVEGLAVLCIIIDTSHRPVALEKIWLNVLNFKPTSLGEVLRPSTK